MILMKDIIQDSHPTLRLKAKEVKLPISDEDKKTLLDLLGYLFNSQNSEKANELGLRSGVGLAAPQINVSKRMFAIMTHDLDGELHILPLVNPEILEHSKEMIYLPGGEGCLSVDTEVTGLVPRHKKLKIKAHKFNLQTGSLEETTFELEDYVAIVFQHEFDHLEGVIFTDKVENVILNAQPLEF